MSNNMTAKADIFSWTLLLIYWIIGSIVWLLEFKGNILGINIKIWLILVWIYLTAVFSTLHIIVVERLEGVTK